MAERFTRIHRAAFDAEGNHVGFFDEGGATDKPGVRCMFGYGEPTIEIVPFSSLRDKYGERILFSEADLCGIVLRDVEIEYLGG